MPKYFSLLAFGLLTVANHAAAAPDNEDARMWLTKFNSPDIVGECYVDKTPCIAATLWHEARSHVDGACLVAWVIMNRIRSPLFPNTLAEVIEQKGQFAFASDGRSDAVAPADKQELNVWYALYQTAYEADTGTGKCGKDPTGGAVFYYATYLGSDAEKVLGVQNLVRAATKGGHYFLKLGPAP